MKSWFQDTDRGVNLLLADRLYCEILKCLLDILLLIHLENRQYNSNIYWTEEGPILNILCINSKILDSMNYYWNKLLPSCYMWGNQLGWIVSSLKPKGKRKALNIKRMLTYICLTGKQYLFHPKWNDTLDHWKSKRFPEKHLCLLH